MQLAGAILRPFLFVILSKRHRRIFSTVQSSNFMDLIVEELSHCGTSPVFCRSEAGKKLSRMTSIHSSHSAESATRATFLTIIFSGPGATKAKRERIFWMERRNNRILSVYGGAAICMNLLRYSIESNYLSVYGQSARHLARLPVVREIRAIHQMLTAYCRITQSGSKDTSTTITNTDDRYAQLLV